MVIREYNDDHSTISIVIPLSEGGITDLDDVEEAFRMIVAQTHVNILMGDIDARFRRIIQIWTEIGD